ncbi:TPA: hypothetical protein DDW35_01105 [Candidatus Sumerlaeota bacterium]|jgi:uncharacterized membrane protein|nr:hypothetical protein [Candidatus Sumerlaeota bacterium]
MPLLQKHSNPSRLLHVLIVIITLWYVYIAISTYFANKYYAHDIGVIDYFFYNTWNGRFFYHIDSHSCFWDTHFTPTLIALVPLHWVFRSFLTIPIIETLAVLSGGWGVAWFTSGVLRRGRKNLATFPPLALALGIMYTANTLTGSVAFAYHYESLVLGLMIWTLAALANQRWRLFWIFLVATLGCKPDIAVYLATFGIWWILFGWDSRKALNVKKRISLGFSITLVSCLWFLLAVSVTGYIRHQQGTPGIPFSERYAANIGDSPLEFLYKFVTHPRAIFILLEHMGSIVLPGVLLLPFLVPSTLILLLPASFIMGFSSQESMHELFYYYSYPFIPFAFLGTALAVRRLLYLTRHSQYKHQLRPALTIFFLLVAAYQFTLPTQTDGRHRLPEKYTARQSWMREVIREVVPPNASVVAQFDMLCQVPHRKDIYLLSEENIHKAEYWVCDNQGFFGNVNGATYGRIMQEGNRLVSEGKAKILVNCNGLVILHHFSLPNVLPQEK